MDFQKMGSRLPAVLARAPGKRPFKMGIGLLKEEVINSGIRYKYFCYLHLGKPQTGENFTV